MFFFFFSRTEEERERERETKRGGDRESAFYSKDARNSKNFAA